MDVVYSLTLAHSTGCPIRRTFFSVPFCSSLSRVLFLVCNQLLRSENGCVCVQGTMRVLLVLLHDFPEFLCDYHYAFCDVIPPNCIQVRNLVLSAFPRNMRLPDPFTPNLKVDMLPEITHAPRVMSNFVSFIQPQSFKKVNFTPFFSERELMFMFAIGRRSSVGLSSVVCCLSVVCL